MYLSEAAAHCGECHTPRTFMGAPDDDKYYAGSVEGPEGELAPNTTPNDGSHVPVIQVSPCTRLGIGRWASRCSMSVGAPYEVMSV